MLFVANFLTCALLVSSQTNVEQERTLEHSWVDSRPAAVRDVGEGEPIAAGELLAVRLLNLMMLEWQRGWYTILEELFRLEGADAVAFPSVDPAGIDERLLADIRLFGRAKRDVLRMRGGVGNPAVGVVVADWNYLFVKGLLRIDGGFLDVGNFDRRGRIRWDCWNPCWKGF